MPDKGIKLNNSESVQAPGLWRCFSLLLLPHQPARPHHASQPTLTLTTFWVLIIWKIEIYKFIYKSNICKYICIKKYPNIIINLLVWSPAWTLNSIISIDTNEYLHQKVFKCSFSQFDRFLTDLVFGGKNIFFSLSGERDGPGIGQQGDLLFVACCSSSWATSLCW